ncbi:LuxR C-terminal-related transcriptional regulator [Amaricoccus sp. W119]|uniref:LuxR C-terminal-related transcriptional regulator n=1 Tax=Amaricoccus sp. W119 TaxID=3391833 RepID=UPI0039A5B943
MGDSMKMRGAHPIHMINDLKNDDIYTSSALSFSIIDSRRLERECFIRAIKSVHQGITVDAYGSASEWRDNTDRAPSRGILFSVGGSCANQPAVQTALRELVAEAGTTPVIVLSESEDLRDMIAAIDNGARGYVPTSVGIDAIIDAAHLTLAGGIFLPVSSLSALRSTIPASETRPTGIEDHFTSRQAAVANALRQGKANKTIAYELNMCESTVKVHIRTIMKKLRASNRTEAAFKLNPLFPEDRPTDR